MRFRHYLTCMTAAMALPLVSQGAIVLYEPFNYGSTNSTLNAVSGSAAGLDGTAYTTNGTTEYLGSGLTFSNLVTAGGAAKLGYHASEARNATRGIDFSVTFGTLYGSMLYKSGGAANNGISALLLTASASHGDTQAKLDVAANEYEGTSTTAQNLMGIRTFSQSTKASGTGMVGDESVTYMVLFQVSNIGATSGTQTVDAWVLTAAQFDNFKAGGIGAAELNAAVTGIGATSVLQKVSHTNTGANGYISLSNSDFLRLVSYRGSGVFDEVRLGTASLDEVTPVPEPTVGLLALVGLPTIAMRRRRR